MNSREMPHAAMNVLMQWVRLRGEQVVSFQTWPQVKGWSTLPEWSVHLEMRSAKTVHVRIKPRGYRFTINAEGEPPACPACAGRSAAQAGLEPAAQAALPAALVAPDEVAFVCD